MQFLETLEKPIQWPPSPIWLTLYYIVSTSGFHCIRDIINTSSVLKNNFSFGILTKIFKNECTYSTLNLEKNVRILVHLVFPVDVLIWWGKKIKRIHQKCRKIWQIRFEEHFDINSFRTKKLQTMFQVKITIINHSCNLKSNKNFFCWNRYFLPIEYRFRPLSILLEPCFSWPSRKLLCKQPRPQSRKDFN